MFTLNHTGTLRKAFAGMALLSSFSMGARGETEETSLNSIDNTKNKIAYAQKHLAEQIKLSGNTYFSGTKDYIPLAQLENVKSGGYYNGVYIDFSKVRPEDVVHAFESGNNPTILNYGATSIKNAKYLGDYQFNLNNTIYELVKYCRKDFPELAKAAGARRCLPLKVSGPFHTRLMAPAGDALAERFKTERFREMQIPVLFNCLGREKADADTIPALLVKQVQSSVYMEDTLRRLGELGVDHILEVGPGSALSGFVKKTLPEAFIANVEDAQSLQKTIEAIKGA